MPRMTRGPSRMDRAPTASAAGGLNPVPSPHGTWPPYMRFPGSQQPRDRYPESGASAAQLGPATSMHGFLGQLLCPMLMGLNSTKSLRLFSSGGPWPGGWKGKGASSTAWLPTKDRLRSSRPVQDPVSSANMPPVKSLISNPQMVLMTGWCEK